MQVDQASWKSAIVGALFCIVGIALVQTAIARYDNVVPHTPLYRLMASLLIMATGGLIVVSAFSKQAPRTAMVTGVAIALVVAFCVAVSGRSIPSPSPGGNRLAFGVPVAMMSAAMVACIWIIANLVARFSHRNEDPDWTDIQFSQWRRPILAVGLSVVVLDIVTPILTDGALSAYTAVLLLTLQIIATSQLLVLGFVFGLTRFRRWKLLVLSLGFYVLLCHTVVVSLIPVLHSIRHPLVTWSLTGLFLDYVLVLPYSIWLGSRGRTEEVHSE